MRITIDAAGRLVVPKHLRRELRIEAGQELEIEAVAGRLELTVPPAPLHLETGPHGLRAVSEVVLPALGNDDVRAALGQIRR